jgi:type IV pilus assembly protein PilA
MKKGFTLIEILLVIALIAILAGIVIIAINPAKQLAEGRNAQRWSNTNTILNAIDQYALDNNGNLPSSIGTTSTEICKTDAAACTGLIDLTILTTDEKYLTAIPMDPRYATGSGVGYNFYKTTNGRVSVSAPFAENGVSIILIR